MTKVEGVLHQPIMVSEILQLAEPILGPLGNNKIYFDGTFGRGGHLSALVQKFPQIKIVAFDQDAEAIAYGKQNFSQAIENHQLQLIHANFVDYEPDQIGLFDFALIDLGVSSPQLDQGSRGFSFYLDGPLDMRMDQRQTLTAQAIIQDYSEKELIRIFQDYGEVRSPFRVVRALVHDRENKIFSSTRDLAGLIERVDGWRKKGVHPATQYFLALRLEVNRELEVTREGIKKWVTSGLKPQGRLVVLTFHSLEDRIVKRLFKEELALWGRPVFKKVIEPSPEELKQNPRARSCKLRVFERILLDADNSSGSEATSGNYKKWKSKKQR